MPPERETSLRRAIEVLLAVADADGAAGVSAIGERLGREKSQVSRTLKVLAEYGFVERDGDAAGYRLGWQVYALAQRAGQPRLLSEARPRLRRLVASLGERAHLSVLHGAEVVTLLSESPGRALEAVAWVGQVTPAYCTSAGQALLLDRDAGGLRTLVDGVELRPRAPATPTSVPALADHLEAGRAAGFVVSHEHFEEGLVSVAAPVRDGGGTIVAALNVSAPKFRFDGRVEEAGEEVRAAADELSHALRGVAVR